MFYLSEIILLIINVIMAEWHTHLKDKNIRYNKDVYVIGYVGIALILTAISRSILLVPTAFLLHKVAYDFAYNIFRGLPLFFVSTSPMSLIDRIHFYFLGKYSEIYQVVYLLLILTINGAEANL
jgi:hypothetical protein